MGRKTKTKSASGVVVLQNLRSKLPPRRVRELLRDLSDPRKQNTTLGEKWCVSPQRIGQFRAALFNRHVVYRLKPDVAAAVQDPQGKPPS